MKFTALFVTALAGLASAGIIGKRAAVSDKATQGFATQNGGTSGGAGGKTVTVTSLSALQSAVTGDTPTIILISGKITGNTVVKPGSNKSIIGKAGSSLEGVGIRVSKQKNVILRNLKISKVVAKAGDAIGIDYSKNVWVDHVDVSSDKTHGKDYYDGLIDVTHGSDWVTISNCYIHDHYKAVLIGHSDNNSGEDTGHLTVTLVGNYFKNINSRGPSFRFGTGHVVNNYYEDVNDGINTRKGAKLLVEGNVFSGSVSKPLYSTDAGYALQRNNNFGTGKATATATSAVSIPYTLNVLSISALKQSVTGNAGQKLSF